MQFLNINKLNVKPPFNQFNFIFNFLHLLKNLIFIIHKDLFII